MDMTLEVSLLVRRDRGPWEPLAGAGTGVAQALVLAEALATAPGRFVFLDEPAVNLHPTWQRHVRARLDELSASEDRRARAQFLVVTHSAALAAPIKAGTALPIRLMLDGSRSIVVGPPTAGEQESPHPQQQHAATADKARSTEPASADNLSIWPKDLSMSPEGWGLLFADGVVLVEGETELGALPRWFEKIAQERNERSWSARNVVIFSVGGDCNFESWGRYLSHYRVPWAVVCDGAILDPWERTGNGGAKEKSRQTTAAERKHWVLLQVSRARDDDARRKAAERLRQEIETSSQRPDTQTFERVRSCAEHLGIFTLANWFAKSKKDPKPPDDLQPIESIDDLIEQDPELKSAKEEAKRAVGNKSSKVRVGLFVANATPAPKAVDNLYGDLLCWFIYAD